MQRNRFRRSRGARGRSSTPPSQAWHLSGLVGAGDPESSPPARGALARQGPRRVAWTARASVVWPDDGRSILDRVIRVSIRRISRPWPCFLLNGTSSTREYVVRPAEIDHRQTEQMCAPIRPTCGVGQPSVGCSPHKAARIPGFGLGRPDRTVCQALIEDGARHCAADSVFISAGSKARRRRN